MYSHFHFALLCYYCFSDSFSPTPFSLSLSHSFVFGSFICHYIPAIAHKDANKYVGQKCICQGSFAANGKGSWHSSFFSRIYAGAFVFNFLLLFENTSTSMWDFSCNADCLIRPAATWNYLRTTCEQLQSYCLCCGFSFSFCKHVFAHPSTFGDAHIAWMCVTSHRIEFYCGDVC